MKFRRCLCAFLVVMVTAMFSWTQETSEPQRNPTPAVVQSPSAPRLLWCSKAEGRSG